MAAAKKQKKAKKRSQLDQLRAVVEEVVGPRFDALDQRFEAMDQRFDGMAEQQHRFGVRLEKLEDQHALLAENLTSFRQEMLRKFAELEARFEARFQVIEQAIRENSADIKKNTEAIEKNTEAILKNTEDIQKNSEDIAILQAEVREVRIELERLKAMAYPPRVEFDALEKRVSELEQRADVLGL